MSLRYFLRRLLAWDQPQLPFPTLPDEDADPATLPPYRSDLPYVLKSTAHLSPYDRSTVWHLCFEISVLRARLKSVQAQADDETTMEI